MDIVKLTEDKLDINEIYSKMVSHSAGAVSLFVGTTRDTFENKKVIAYPTSSLFTYNQFLN